MVFTFPPFRRDLDPYPSCHVPAKRHPGTHPPRIAFHPRGAISPFPVDLPSRNCKRHYNLNLNNFKAIILFEIFLSDIQYKESVHHLRRDTFSRTRGSVMLQWVLNFRHDIGIQYLEMICWTRRSRNVACLGETRITKPRKIKVNKNFSRKLYES